MRRGLITSDVIVFLPRPTLPVWAVGVSIALEGPLSSRVGWRFDPDPHTGEHRSRRGEDAGSFDHERQTGVNTITGEGLAQALDGVDAVVDVSNSPSFEDDAAMQFFRTATTNLLAAESAAEAFRLPVLDGAPPLDVDHDAAQPTRRAARR